LDGSTDSVCEPAEHEEEDSNSCEEEQTGNAVIAIIDTATKDQASGHEHSKRCHCSSELLFSQKIRVLLDSGSDGDIWFHQKGATNHFPYTKDFTSAAIFQTKGQAKFTMKFFEYSDSKHYDITPDVFEHDEMGRPVFDLIIGMKTMKKLGIVLDFWTNEIEIDHISLPMRDINKLQLKSKIDRDWA
jgi:hypothetical protein